ncbi:hypothetical protein [Krasilnikovia sp. MM14-A1259]|uniref:hypothetical protein n=1 Tax=Krasilnikovia sp. MM14-A1259 TaxID=3373539 RepID=UPI0037FAD0DF
MRTEHRLMRRTDGVFYTLLGLHPTPEAAAAATNVPDLEAWNVSLDGIVRYVDGSPGLQWRIESEQVPESDQDRIELSLELAFQYGQIDGEHHKTWVIDQIVRTLAGDRYEQLIVAYRDGEDGPESYSWDEGIAP